MSGTSILLKRRLGRSLWDGAISFGLVNIPVRLYPGVRAKDVRFHMLHQKDHARLEEKFFCTQEEREVPRAEVARGFEVRKNQHVIVQPSELESLAPHASHTIDLQYFVQQNEIDPAYFDRPYYLLPEENSVKAYRLLAQAMAKTQKGAIAQFVMHNKEYVALIRSAEEMLCLDTMRFPDEIVLASELRDAVPEAHVSDREVQAAAQLIQSLTRPFEPQHLHDEYREAVLQLIQRKAEGEEIPLPAPVHEEEGPQVIDLMAALQKSLQNVKKQKLKRSA